MLSLDFIRQNPEKVQQGCRDKNIPCDLSALLAVDRELKEVQQAMEKLQARRNKLSSTIPHTFDAQRSELVDEVRQIKAQLDVMKQQHKEFRESLHQQLLRLPQPPRQDVPLGATDQDSTALREWGSRPTFSFTPRSHIELGEELGLFDFVRAARLAGSRSYVLSGRGALLEQAVLRFAFDQLLQRHYTPMSVPILVRESCMEGTGYFPVGRDQAYLCEKDRLALVGTSEVSLCSYYQGETFEEHQLPMKLFAQSTCFRREAGSYGKDTKGLYRVHQFQKVEQVILASRDAEGEEQLHQELLSNAEHLLQALELPYRVVMVCSGDLGQGQYYKHDLETWMPSRRDYGETHSCSSFLDFQARRLGIRYRSQEGEQLFCYTLNNTAVASPRILIPLMECHQTASGDVWLPQALRPYLQGKSYLSELTRSTERRP